MNQFAVHLKLTQHCKLTIFQFKNKCLSRVREKKAQAGKTHRISLEGLQGCYLFSLFCSQPSSSNPLFPLPKPT